MDFTSNIFAIKDDQDFRALALEAFDFQYANNPVYKQFVDLTGAKKPIDIYDIPFLPISFFKSHELLVDGMKSKLVFKSSGTGGDRSKHLVADPRLYERSFNTSYRKLIGDPSNQVILALLPNYLEQGESSLIYMVDQLIKQADELSGFVLNSFDELHDKYNRACNQNKQVIIFGVSYALLDLATYNYSFDEAIIIETGGMKGRRKELTKQQLHDKLKTGLNTNNIFSEYGMTELLSQAYSKTDLVFHTPEWMRVIIRDTNDPLTIIQEQGTSGGINIIDLANIYSCPFIATQDLGKLVLNGFQILGRFDNADIRGCNLLVQ